MKEQKKREKGLLSGVYLAYSILIFHALLLGLLFIIIVFFRSIVHHMLWFIVGGILITLTSGYYFFRKLKKNSGQIRDLMNDPAFQGRSLEISLFGGVASIKMGAPGLHTPAIEHNPQAMLQLEDPKTERLKELNNIAELLEKGFITNEEYSKLKNELLS